MLNIEDISFSYGGEQIISNFSLKLPERGVFAIMGASGCGKSTLFSLICGLLKPSEGKITLGSERLAFAFQEPRLLPWMTAAENVNFVLGGKKSTLQNAKAALSKVGLGNDTEKYPSELSGGMQKRVSLARAFAIESDILLLDEPFTGLDFETKNGIIERVREIGKKSLVLMITHDAAEANECAEMTFTFSELNQRGL